jgi:hypothetical protein
MRKFLQNVMCENFTEAKQAMTAIREIAEAAKTSGLELSPAHFDDIRLQENIWSEAMGRYVLAAKQHKGLTITKEKPVG